MKFVSSLVIALVLCCGLGGAAQAAAITATYEAAGVETPNASAICGSTAGCQVAYENFNFITQSQATNGFTTNYSTGTGTASPISGTYSAFDLYSADQYGGAGGTGKYPEIFGSNNPPSYSINLVNTATGGGVNYFGLWISALDASNTLQFYDASGNLIYTYTSQQLISDLGSCSGGHAANAYCGNPSNSYADSGEQFAYVNFFDTLGTFSKIVVSEAGGGGAGFESDNHAVAYIQNLTVSSGTSVIPEPASWSVILLSLLVVFRLKLRKGGSWGIL